MFGPVSIHQCVSGLLKVNTGGRYRSEVYLCFDMFCLVSIHQCVSGLLKVYTGGRYRSEIYLCFDMFGPVCIHQCVSGLLKVYTGGRYRSEIYLCFDMFGPVCIHQCVSGLLKVYTGGRYVSNHHSLTVPTQCILQQTSQFTVPVVHITFTILISCKRDRVALQLLERFTAEILKSWTWQATYVNTISSQQRTKVLTSLCGSAADLCICFFSNIQKAACHDVYHDKIKFEQIVHPEMVIF